MAALDTSRDVLQAGPAVVLGDFNSSAVFDRTQRPEYSHAALVRRLRGEFGLVSAYHTHYRVEHGSEAHPTYFHQWKENAPFHLDYCFVPETWAPRIRSVEVGTWAAWEGRSDHRPLLVNLDPDGR